MKELKITPIKNGTVIDHIEAGTAMKVARILGLIDSEEKNTISIAMYVKSKKMGFKDIMKIENRELKKKEVNKISLFSPNATIIIIKNQEVAKKYKVSLPKVLKGIARCSNPNCITRQKEPVESEFEVTNGKEINLRCLYCDRNVTDILASIM